MHKINYYFIIIKKIIGNSNKQENANHSEEKNQSIGTDPEMMQMMWLVDKDIQRVIINAYYMLKKLEEKFKN